MHGQQHKQCVRMCVCVCTGEATEKVQNLLKELSGIAPAAPAGEGEDASAAPPAAPRTVPEAAHELSRVLEADLKDKLAPTQVRWAHW